MTPFDFIKKTDPQQILNFIQNEHPQTIALVLSHLSPDQASNILSSLPPEVQLDVSMRIATMDRATPEVIMEVEKVLERRIASVFTQEFASAGGVRHIAEILNRVDRSTEKAIMEKLEEKNPDLADEIKRLINLAVQMKPQGHNINLADEKRAMLFSSLKNLKPMYKIGG